MRMRDLLHKILHLKHVQRQERLRQRKHELEMKEISDAIQNDIRRMQQRQENDGRRQQEMREAEQQWLKKMEELKHARDEQRRENQQQLKGTKYSFIYLL